MVVARVTSRVTTVGVRVLTWIWNRASGVAGVGAAAAGRRARLGDMVAGTGVQKEVQRSWVGSRRVCGGRVGQALGCGGGGCSAAATAFRKEQARWRAMRSRCARNQRAVLGGRRGGCARWVVCQQPLGSVTLVRMRLMVRQTQSSWESRAGADRARSRRRLWIGPSGRRVRVALRTCRAWEALRKKRTTHATRRARTKAGPAFADGGPSPEEGASRDDDDGDDATDATVPSTRHSGKEWWGRTPQTPATPAAAHPHFVFPTSRLEVGGVSLSIGRASKGRSTPPCCRQGQRACALGEPAAPGTGHTHPDRIFIAPVSLRISAVSPVPLRDTDRAPRNETAREAGWGQAAPVGREGL